MGDLISRREAIKLLKEKKREAYFDDEAYDEAISVITEMPDAKKPLSNKKEVDAGKICALWTAGWSRKDIALDVRCDPKTVDYHLRKAGLKYDPEEEAI